MFDWKKYISSDEKVLFDDVQSLIYRRFFAKFWFFLFSFVAFSLAFLVSLLTFSIAFPFMIVALENILITTGLLCFVYIFGTFLYWILGVYYKSIHFCVTNKGIYKVSGFINIDVVFIPYKKITDIKMDLGFFERKLGVGTIWINTAGGSSDAEIVPFFAYKNIAINLPRKSSSYEMKISHIKNYSEFMEVINKNLD